jgi:hypothetical protein
VGEFVGSRAGLGMLIQSMNFNMDVAGQFSILIVLSLVGLVLNKGIAAIRRQVLFWDPSEKARAERWLVEEAEGRQDQAAEPGRSEEAKVW